MERWTFGPEEVKLVAQGQADEVERRLLNSYESAKDSGNTTGLQYAISSLAHFYALPFKEDLEKADRFFREALLVSPGADSAVELVFFCHYVLADPGKTLQEVARVRALTDKGRAGDLRFLYTAVAMEGQAHLAVGQEQDAIRNLEELLEMAARDPDHVPFGDEFNFVEQIVTRNLARETCTQLLNIVRLRVRSVEYRDKVEKLLRSMGWDDAAP